MGVEYLLNNMGHIVPVPGTSAPEPATGQTLTNAAADTDTSATVEAGKRYAITCLSATAGLYAGVATVATAANIIWACPPASEIIIVIPNGVTTLHYAVTANGAKAYMRELPREE